MLPICAKREPQNEALHKVMILETETIVRYESKIARSCASRISAGLACTFFLFNNRQPKACSGKAVQSYCFFFIPQWMYPKKVLFYFDFAHNAPKIAKYTSTKAADCSAVITQIIAYNGYKRIKRPANLHPVALCA